MKRGERIPQTGEERNLGGAGVFGGNGRSR